MNYYELLTVGSVVAAKFEKGPLNLTKISASAGWRTYHNFQKVEIPQKYYEETGLTDRDVQVELAYIEGATFERPHYHKKAHAVNIILGHGEGFANPSLGSTVIHNDQAILAKPRRIFYFEPCDLHTFNGGSGGMFFLSIQSPPLETKEGDDFYYQELGVHELNCGEVAA